MKYTQVMICTNFKCIMIWGGIANIEYCRLTVGKPTEMLDRLTSCQQLRTGITGATVNKDFYLGVDKNILKEG